jgi:hypothetical protein
MSKFDDNLSKNLFYGAGWSFATAWVAFMAACFGGFTGLYRNWDECTESAQAAFTTARCAYPTWTVSILAVASSFGLVLYVLLLLRSRSGNGV